MRGEYDFNDNLDAVVTVYAFAHLLGGLQQLGRMRQAVVALA